MKPRLVDFIGAAVLAFVLFGLVALLVVGNIATPQA